MAKKRRGCLPDIPLDVWNEVLLRVPAESLVHFKRVCKGWHGLIGGDRFVVSHLERWRPRRPMMLCGSMSEIPFVPLGFEGEQLKSHYSEPWLRDCLTNALEELRERVRTRFGARLQVLDSCDGLILFRFCSGSTDPQQLLVCNPITKSFVVPPPCDSSNNIHGLKWAIAGNGASSQDYKIVGIRSNAPIWLPPVMTCFVFDLSREGGREPSSWKELHLDVPWYCSSRVFGPPVLAMGRKVHWLIELVHDEEVVLLSLDLSTERLSLTRILSEEPTFKGWTYDWLYSDRVMCSVWHPLPPKDPELWVLEDLDSQPIWRKHHLLTGLPERSKFMKFTQWRGIYMEAEGKIVIDDGLVYCVSSRAWSDMIDLDSVYCLRQSLCRHVNSLVKI